MIPEDGGSSPLTHPYAKTCKSNGLQVFLFFRQWSTSIVACLIVFLIVAVVFERRRADNLELQLRVIRQPMLDAIAETESEIRKCQLQYDYALQELEFDHSFTSISQGLTSEMANVRNSKLKLDRLREQLREMKTQIEF